MLCVACGEVTPQAPCGLCRQEPRLDGRYDLIEIIGQGSTGTTYRARSGDRVVAIKESLLQKRDAAKVRELVEREARVLRQLSHPQIPTYIEEIWRESGRTASLFLVQEHVEGVDLSRRLDEARYDEDEVLALLLDLCGVITYLHGLSPPVLHRDLKPANVIRRPDGSHVLVDFGSVRDALKDADLGGSTVAGTFGYMAPEQFAGDASPKTDLYGLGALAVALLTRRDPATLQAADRTVDWHAYANVSPSTRQLLDELLAWHPDDRPPSAAAVAERILTPHDARPTASPEVAMSRSAPLPSLLSESSDDPEPVFGAALAAVQPEPFHLPPAAHEGAPVATPAEGGGASPAVVGVTMISLMLVGMGASVAMYLVAATEVPTVTAAPAQPVVEAAPAEQLQVASSTFTFRPHEPLTEADRRPIGARLRRQPDYPPAMKPHNLPPVKCRAQVDVGSDGQPDGVTVSACPLGFHATVAESLQTWRWNPPGVPVYLTVMVTFINA